VLPWLVLGFGLACSPSVEEPPPPSGLLAGSWVAEIVTTPARFTERLGTQREGWIALHRNDWKAAVAAGGDPAARAHGELSRFYGVLADLDAEAWARTGLRWKRRGDLPADSLLPTLVAAALRDAGREEEASTWTEGAAPSGELAERKRLHDAVRAGSEPDSRLRELPWAAVHEVGAGGTREFADPWLLRSLAQTEFRKAESQAPLERELFSGTVRSPVDPPPAVADVVADGDACREQVRHLDADLDGWRTSTGLAASAEGRQLLDELRLVPGLRARLLTDLAIAALRAQRPGCALAYGQLAIDYESPREIGAVNSPTLFAVVASAQLHHGRTREALDTLEALRNDWPELAGLDETLGTLVVLEGMDRSGDSRE
jgi:hypothetical protein